LIYGNLLSFPKIIFYASNRSLFSSILGRSHSFSSGIYPGLVLIVSINEIKRLVDKNMKTIAL
jgi:hypothetical protein